MSTSLSQRLCLHIIERWVFSVEKHRIFLFVSPIRAADATAAHARYLLERTPPTDARAGGLNGCLCGERARAFICRRIYIGDIWVTV